MDLIFFQRRDGRGLPVLCQIAALVVALCGRVSAADSTVADLYRNFLNGHTSQGFIALDRRVSMVSGRRAGAGGEGGSNVWSERAVLQNGYLTLCWNGSNYIAADSKRGPATNVEALAAADYLYGFDGRDYWYMTLSLDYQVSAPDQPNGTPAFRGKGQAKYKLTILPKAEVDADRKQGRDIPQNFHIVERYDLERERLTQFGFESPLDGLPQIQGARLVATEIIPQGGRRKMTLDITGPPERPEMLTGNASNSEPYNVSLDYEHEGMEIDELSKYGPIPVTVSRYRILAWNTNAPPTKSAIYSWRNYQPGAPGVDSIIITNGVDHKVVASGNGQVVVGRALGPPPPLASPWPRIQIVIGIVLVLGFLAVLFLRYYQR